MEKREPFYTAGGNVNFYNHCGKRYICSLKQQQQKKLKIELPYDLAVSVFGTYPEKTLI